MYSARGLLFDLDGTLVDSVPDIAAATNATLSALGLPVRPESSVRDWIGNGAPRLLKRAMTNDADGEPDEALFERALPLFYDHYAKNNGPRSRLYPDVEKILTDFRRQGFRLGCVTNKPERHTGPLLAYFNLAQLFEVVIGGDTLAVRKPDPEPLLHAARALGVAPAECIMIGDSLSDLKAGKSAGMTTFCMGYGYNQGADLLAAGADRMLDGFDELSGLIRAPD